MDSLNFGNPRMEDHWLLKPVDISRTACRHFSSVDSLANLNRRLDSHNLPKLNISDWKQDSDCAVNWVTAVAGLLSERDEVEEVLKHLDPPAVESFGPAATVVAVLKNLTRISRITRFHACSLYDISCVDRSTNCPADYPGLIPALGDHVCCYLDYSRPISDSIQELWQESGDLFSRFEAVSYVFASECARLKRTNERYVQEEIENRLAKIKEAANNILEDISEVSKQIEISQFKLQKLVTTAEQFAKMKGNRKNELKAAEITIENLQQKIIPSVEELQEDMMTSRRLLEKNTRRKDDELVGTAMLRNFENSFLSSAESIDLFDTAFLQQKAENKRRLKCLSDHEEEARIIEEIESEIKKLDDTDTSLVVAQRLDEQKALTKEDEAVENEANAGMSIMTSKYKAALDDCQRRADQIVANKDEIKSYDVEQSKLVETYDEKLRMRLETISQMETVRQNFRRQLLCCHGNAKQILEETVQNFEGVCCTIGVDT